VDADFEFEKLDSCSSPRVQFTNTSKFKAGGPVQFGWDFGDGTTFNGRNPPVHNYAATGTYTVKLVVTDTTACNSPDSVIKTVDINGFQVNAAFTIKDTVCGLTITMQNTSTNVQTYAWDFGDGGTSTQPAPTHTYSAPGTYTVSLFTYNPLSCNGKDSMIRVVTFKNKPKADFSHTPDPPLPNEPIQFTNQSNGATSYLWKFGYNDQTSTNANPSHLYTRSGKFDVCLVAYNDEGCTDTLCKPVDAVIDRIADVPNAFTPNGDGKNDILYVHGAAIQQFSFKLFDRWGHLIFETTSLDRGWDGNYNGQPSPTEGYAYLLDVTFTDGVTLVKKGNITLLR
jgi:gliding motility-associated-like protein